MGGQTPTHCGTAQEKNLLKVPKEKKIALKIGTPEIREEVVGGGDSPHPPGWGWGTPHPPPIKVSGMAVQLWGRTIPQKTGNFENAAKHQILQKVVSLKKKIAQNVPWVAHFLSILSTLFHF